VSLALVAAPVGIRGFVEARTAEAILGWAWDPARPEARLTVALRLGGEVVAEAEAALPREDLARGGIGDGAHAFRIDLNPALAGRLDALAVTVTDAEDRVQRLEEAPVAPVEQLALARLQRGIEHLVAGQRTLLRRAAPEQEATELLARIAAAQERTAAQVETLEVFVMRLDARLAALAAVQPPPRMPARSLALAGLLGAAAALAMTLALGALR